MSETAIYLASIEARGVHIEGNLALFNKHIDLWLGYLPEEQPCWFGDKRQAYKFRSEQAIREAMARALKGRPGVEYVTVANTLSIVEEKTIVQTITRKL